MIKLNKKVASKSSKKGFSTALEKKKQNLITIPKLTAHSWKLELVWLITTE